MEPLPTEARIAYIKNGLEELSSDRELRERLTAERTLCPKAGFDPAAHTRSGCGTSR